ncbi:MAG: FAD-dependent oxidoreductase [Acidobacteriota bacterium]
MPTPAPSLDLFLPDWFAQLPAQLADRPRLVAAPGHDPAARPRAGRFVLYWMRSALRATENAALDVALELGRALERPVFVYQGLDERYPYASDRHHTFILESARDVARDLAARGIGYAFHLARPDDRGPHLRTLAQRAAAVVTDDLPVPFLDAWAQRLAAAIDAPTIAVDAACVLPLGAVGRAYATAAAFRRATDDDRRARLAEPWRDASPTRGGAFVPELPFAPIDLAGADLPSLVAQCAVDHDVAPVPHTRGGASAAEARWHAFRDEGGLKRYRRDRNDALKDGVSWLSPYLHHGCIAATRVAREAQAAARADSSMRTGVEKYLDELLTWRELAHAFCRFGGVDVEALGALPDWAQRTLAAHAGDPRPALRTWEQLARGRAGDALWDAAQADLRIHGRLHNNVRMTWGKAIPQWTPDPATALATLIDLNHRYALDGRDPNSYGGLLWCLGLFDRGFAPPRPVLGLVRPRSADAHARRLRVERYAERTTRPALRRPPRVAVVGGGIAGLACARVLADHGLAVTVFDKGRGPGGRASTRRVDGVGTFDHGAQYFTARDPHFARRVASWQQIGAVAPWTGTIVHLDADGRAHERAAPRIGDATAATRWVGTPGMNAVLAHLGAELDVRHGHRVDALIDDGRRWRLTVDAPDDAPAQPASFDVVALAVPAAQAAALVPRLPELRAQLDAVEMAPCIAALVAYDAPLDAAFDGAFVHDGPLGWVARNASKPGRAAGGPADTWVLHASVDWSTRHLEREPEASAAPMLRAFAQLLGGARLPKPVHRAVHRWRYARTLVPIGEPCLYEPTARLGVCGDFCLGAKVEAAWRSGIALAGRILGRAAADDDRLADDEADADAEPDGQLRLFAPAVDGPAS